MKKISLLMALVAIAMISCSSHETKTVALGNQTDSLNYALGYANGAQMKMYQLRADSTFEATHEFLDALVAGYKGKVAELSDLERQGQSIGQALKNMEKTGLVGNKAWRLNEKLFFQGLVNGLHHDTTIMTGAFARQYFQDKYAATSFNDSIEVEKAIKGKCGNAVRTVKLATENDSLNYAFGLFNGEDFARQWLVADSLGTDAKVFIASINKGLKSRIKNPQIVNMGEQIGTSIREQEAVGLLGIEGVETKFDHIYQGFVNGLKGFEEQMNLQQANEYVQTTFDAIKYGPAKEEGRIFLEENAKREGVHVTESGLQYEILKQGKGKKPTAESTVKVHYAGTLLDGTEFDSSYKRGEPTSFGVGQVIKGWTEGLQLMNVGSKYKFYIPYDLAYGERSAGQSIPPYSTLIFEVELLGIEK